MVMQGKKSNYDTDVFQPLIQEIAKRASLTYGANEEADIAMRVCADHLRAVSFSIADGQLPSNAKAGYVIRRILRRAVRYGYTFLGFKEPFMHTLVPTLVAQMGGQFPELVKQKELIERIILEEEQSFLKTLSNGIMKFENYIAKAMECETSCEACTQKATVEKVIDGAFAFELFDTYGFPVDLTQLMAAEKGWTVDMEGFAKGLAEQKDRSRAAAKTESDDWVVLKENVEEQFVGYDELTCEVNIIRYRHVRAKEREFYQLVFDRTPFYGESGGQVGDVGTIGYGEEVIPIVDTKKENNLIVHIVSKLPSDMTVTFKAEVDKCRRFAIQCNHSATHLLHKALRNVLGTHVEQKGSSVDDKRLRFDFSHFAKLTQEEIREVEKQVNIDIWHAIPLEEHRAMPIEEARKLGAMALFGEKYGEKVRVVKFGDSVEFCGGTHTDNTGHIGSLRIVAEGAVAAGMRRIEAVTGAAAERYVDSLQDQLESAKQLLKNPKDLSSAIQKLQEENATLRSQIEAFQKAKVADICKSFGAELAKSPVLSKKLDFDIMQLKDGVLQLAKNNDDMALVLGSVVDGKPQLMICLGQNRVAAGKNAGTIIRTAGKEIQGGGGGQPAYATAGGKNAQGIDNAIAVALKEIGE